MKKFFLSLCFITVFGAGLSSCTDDAAEVVPSQQKELSEILTDDETRTKKPR